MATIRRNRTKWQAIIRRKGYPQQSKTFLSKTDARKWARQVESNLDAGVLTLSDRSVDDISVRDMLLRYRQDVTPTKKGAKSEKNRIDAFLRQPWAALKVSVVKPSTFSAYRDFRLKQVQPATVRRDLGLIRAIFEYGIREWGTGITENPLARIQKPKEPPARCRRLEEGELAHILEASERHREPWLKYGIQMALETGMRRSELLGLLWVDVDWVNSTVLIRNSKNGSPRNIPLSVVAIQVLQMLKDGYEAPDRSVFQVSSNAFQLSWQRCKKRAAKTHPQILDLRFHDLRHEAISRFFELGLSVPEVALISGHKDVRMLFRYTHLRAKDVAEKLRGSVL